MSVTSLRWIRTGALASIAVLLFARPSYALQRKIWDGSRTNDGQFYLDFPSVTLNYTFGRSEGKPERGPSPAPFGPLVGSTDVDQLYDYFGLINVYYTEKFGRNGPNGFGGTSTGVVTPLDEMAGFANGNATHGGAYASWPRTQAEANSFIWRGSVVFTAGWVVPDMVGHEMFHIVVFSNWKNPDGTWQYNPSGYQNLRVGESGALNEGMADFFGESFERWLTGTNDWLNAANVDTTVIPRPEMRNLADPPSTQNPPLDVSYPDRYLSPNFYVGTYDSGGEHINSTIISKAAYLASEGGSFNGYDVVGIGMDKVEQILYRALTTYFDPNEDFNGAYDGFLQATADLYGTTELSEMTKALQAVELHLSRIALAGDYDRDTDVDGADFLEWQRQFGSPVDAFAGADGNGDGIVDAADYVVWRKNFGITGGAGASTNRVPEPRADAMLLCAVCIAAEWSLQRIRVGRRRVANRGSGQYPKLSGRVGALVSAYV